MDIVKASGIKIKYKTVEREEVDYESMESSIGSLSNENRLLAGNEAKEYYTNHGKYGKTPSDDKSYYTPIAPRKYSIENVRMDCGVQAQISIVHHTENNVLGTPIDYKTISAPSLNIAVREGTHNPNHL